MAREIELTKGKVAIVDDEDYEWLIKLKWHYNPRQNEKTTTGYAVHNITIAPNTQTLVYMHRMILNVPKDVKVDHINGNTLDNKKSNLRVASAQQNNFNRKHHDNVSSRFKGVCWHKRDKIWAAGICRDGKIMFLGYFDDEIQAARAYNKAALKYFGEFAKLNEFNEEKEAC